MNNFTTAAGVAAISFAVICLFGSFYLLSSTFNWFNDENTYENQISFDGTGEVFAIPDVTTFSYSINETADTVAEAQQLSNVKNNKVLAILKAAGIEDKDIKTVNYNIYPKYEWEIGVCQSGYCESGKNILIGQEVAQTVSVKVRETEKAPDLLGKIGAVEVSNVSNLSFSIDDTDILKAEARKLAIANAREKAEQIEKELGIKLGKVISFYESTDGYYPEPMMYSAKAEMSSDSMTSEVSLPAGENKIVSRINLVFEVEK